MKKNRGLKILLAILVVVCAVLCIKVLDLSAKNKELIEKTDEMNSKLFRTAEDLRIFIKEYEKDKPIDEVIKKEMAQFQYDGFSEFGNKKLTMAGTLTYSINTKSDIEFMELVFGEKTFAMTTDKEGKVSFEGSEAIDITEAIDNDVLVKILYVHVKTTDGQEYNIYPEFSEWMSYEIGNSLLNNMVVEQRYEVEEVK